MESSSARWRDWRMPSVRYCTSKNTAMGKFSIRLFVLRFFSSAGILRAVGVGGKSHPRDFGASLNDRLSNDYSRDAAAHGENTVDKWVHLVSSNCAAGVNSSENGGTVADKSFKLRERGIVKYAIIRQSRQGRRRWEEICDHYLSPLRRKILLCTVFVCTVCLNYKDKDLPFPCTCKYYLRLADTYRYYIFRSLLRS